MSARDIQPDPQDTSATVSRHAPPAPRKVSIAEILAGGAGLAWLLGFGIYLFSLPQQGVRDAVLTAIAVVLPALVLWGAMWLARSIRMVRAEAGHLRDTVERLRAGQSARAAGDRDAALIRKLDEIVAAQRKAETAMLTLASIRDTMAERAELNPPVQGDDAPEDNAQAPLPLERITPEAAPLPNGIFIRALNFPETAEDEDGFAALRRAMRDRQARLLVQAAQDVLTLLSQEGIYMDDLRPDIARAELWRRFAAGERGGQVATLGGIRDRSSLALAAGRMKEDPVFRDAVHHFLRRFDTQMESFVPGASDGEIAELADTRTARAFMLVGRVAGIFDHG